MTSDDHRRLTPTDPEWPTDRLQALSGRPGGEGQPAGAGRTAPPTELWLRGSERLDQLADRLVAIVGTRDATPYGTHVAADLAYGLARQGWTVLAGGGFGIDAAAHRGALAAGGAPVAVLASGLNRLYPTAHHALFERISRNGLLVSAQPPDVVQSRVRVLASEHLVAALAAAVVVVEAIPRGGALRIAGAAEACGRPVFAVPGPVTSAPSSGCHQLLRAGRARLVENVADVLDHIGR